MKINEVYTKDPQIADAKTSIKDISQMMRENNCGSIPVVENDKIIGMVTDRDIVLRCVAEGRDAEETYAKDIMTDGILYCYENDNVEDIAKNMADNSVRRLPVLNKEKRLTGIVSLGDLSLGSDSACGEALEQIRLSPKTGT